MMSLCQSIDTLTMAYLDDELADEELRDFELHLRDCAGCRAHVDGERETLGELRRQLAAPAMPDVARARLRAALDREDEQASRADRRGRIASWLLPGAASLAAVAAIALFVVTRIPSGSTAPAPIEMVKNSPRSFEVPAVAGLQPVALDGPDRSGPSVYRVATWRERTHGVDVVGQAFVIRGAGGGEIPLQARVFDARRWNIEFGEPFVAHGRRMWFASADGVYAVVHKSRDGVGYILSSEALGPRELTEVVSRIDFVRIADARLAD